MTSRRPARAGAMNAARSVSSSVDMPCSVTRTGTPVDLVGVRDRAGQRQRVRRRCPSRSGHAVRVGPGPSPSYHAFVVLHPDEVVVPAPDGASGRTPRRACGRAPTCRRRRQSSTIAILTDRQFGSPGLDGGLAAMAGGDAPAIASMSSGSTRWRAGTLDAGRLAAPPRGSRDRDRGRSRAGRPGAAGRGSARSSSRRRRSGRRTPPSPGRSTGEHLRSIGVEEAAALANQCGAVKWLNVTTGARPSSRQPSTIAS